MNTLLLSLLKPFTQIDYISYPKIPSLSPFRLPFLVLQVQTSSSITYYCLVMYLAAKCVGVRARVCVCACVCVWVCVGVGVLYKSIEYVAVCDLNSQLVAYILLAM